MNSVFLSLAVVATLHACVAANTPGTLHFDIARSEEPSLRKRGSTVTADLYNELEVGIYLINVTIGSPPQTMSLHLDTGSSDTWVVSSNNTACQGGECLLGSCKFDHAWENKKRNKKEKGEKN